MASEWSYSERVGLVPTMGYLHEGHLALVRKARSKADKVIVSIFVNPLQFGPSEDFAKYPRDFGRDAALLGEAGADLIFYPTADDITPESMVVSVDPGEMSNVLCGRFRPGHFRGVCTIVTKLFQIIRPGFAVFGWKDAQQFLILRKMIEDLNIPIIMEALDTVRDPDGLAMSSRNNYLTSEQRRAAPAIYQGLQAVETAVKKGTLNVDELFTMFRQRVAMEPELEIQYVEAVSMDRLEPLQTVVPGNSLIAAAVYAGSTRLIDNLRL